jgi:hypothetical protein
MGAARGHKLRKHVAFQCNRGGFFKPSGVLLLLQMRLRKLPLKLLQAQTI